MASITLEVRRATEEQRLLKKITQIRKAREAKEKKLLAKGYRWVSISENSKIFVPCNKKGKPTEEGKQRIKEYLGKIKNSTSII